MARKRKLPTGMLQKPGRPGYWCDFWAGGRRLQRKLSNDFKAARTILNQLRARADQSEFGILDNDCSVADLRDSYSRHIQQARPRSYGRYKQSLEQVLPALGAVKVFHIDADAVLRFRQERLDGGVCARTVNHDVTILGAMLNWGVRNRMIGHNPVKGMARLRHDNPKNGRPLAPDEVSKLLDASPQPWRDIWYAFLVTGLRSGELSALTFDDIEWENRELVVRADRSKNHEGRRVPIDDGLYDILKRQETARQNRRPGVGKTPYITRRIRERFTRDHVFVTTQNTPLTHRSCLWHALKRCCALARIEMKRLDASGREIDHIDVHSFRRTFATDAISNRADPKSVQEILGHKTLDMTMRIYAKMRAETKRQAVARLSYGMGSKPPAHLVQLPESRPMTVQFGEKVPSIEATHAGASSQRIVAQ